MAHDRRAAGERKRRPTSPGSHLFAVRLWKEETDGGAEYRGSVRDVVSGAYRNFRAWPDLAAFMVARMEEDGRTGAGPAEGGCDGDAASDG
jgi:hypothetical protein